LQNIHLGKLKSFLGELTYKLDSLKERTVFREFKRTKCKITDENLQDISKTFSIDKNKGNLYFFEETGLDEDTYFATASSRQNEIELNELGQKNLVSKLANLATTGDENISFKKAIDKLDKKMKDDIGTDRTIDRPLNVLNKKIAECQNLININTIQKSELSKTVFSLEQSIQKQNYEQNKLNLLNSLKQLKEKEKLIDDLKVEPLQQKNNSNVLFILALIVGIILICSSFIMNTTILKSLAIALGIIFLVSSFIFKNKNSKKALSSATPPTVEHLENNLEEIYKEFIEFSKKEIQGYLENSIDSIDNLILEQKELVTQITAQVYKLTYEKERLEKEVDLANYEQELQILLNQKEELNSLASSIKLATSELEKAYLEMKKEVIPEVTAELSQFASKITNEAYSKVAFSDETGLTVQLKNGDTKQIDKLSIGTMHQLYLALRLSILKLILKKEKNVPILIDESFAFYDEERLKSTLEFLGKLSKDTQIVIFSCTKKEIEILKQANMEFNLIQI